MTLRGVVMGASFEALHDVATRRARALHGLAAYMDSPCLRVELGDIDDVTPFDSSGSPTFRAAYTARVVHDWPLERISDRDVTCRRCGEA